MATINPRRDYTKAQKEFLYRHIIFRILMQLHVHMDYQSF